MPPKAPPAASLSAHQVGLIFFFVSIGYVVLIVIFDSLSRRKLAVSPNLLRHLMDGLTFATGITVALSVFEPGLFLVVASNVVYATVTAGACILGPAINLAERYGYLIDK